MLRRLNPIIFSWVILHANNVSKELSLDFWLVDNLSDQFSFYRVNCKDMEVKNAHWNNLSKIFDELLSNPKTALVISDASIKNDIATSILHI